MKVAPLAFMRGRTLNDSFVILDEAQNTTSEQMKMFLTRIGFGAKAVVTGDVPDYALVYGNPARLHGHVCACGEKLPVGTYYLAVRAIDKEEYLGVAAETRQVQIIADFKPDIIMVTPSYSLAIADEMERQGVDPKRCSLRLISRTFACTASAMRLKSAV